MAADKPFGSSFGDLLRAKGLAPAAPAAPAPSAAPPQPPDPTDMRGTVKLVVRREKTGRGGKTVTVVEFLPPTALEATARALRHGLGCGATVEGERVVVQGEQTARVIAWLQARGAPKVVKGN